MNAEKYLKDKNHTIEAIECYDKNLTNGTMNIIEIIEGYHQAKLKLMGIGDVSESLLDQLSDRKDMAHQELKSTINVDYFSFVGGWTLAIESVKKLSERANSC